MIKSFKMPPLVFKKKSLPVGSIKSISNFSSNKIIFKKDVFHPDNFQENSSGVFQVVVKTKDGKEEMFETEKPLDFLKAVQEMFLGGRN